MVEMVRFSTNPMSPVFYSTRTNIGFVNDRYQQIQTEVSQQSLSSFLHFYTCNDRENVIYSKWLKPGT